MTEQQPYQVLAERPGYQLRQYPAHVLAETEVQGSFEQAGNAGFRPLVGYLSSGGVAMTAPVLQDQGSPAVGDADPTAGDSHRVAFVMPAAARLNALPVPADARVRMREVPEEVVAASAFSGRWTRAAARRHGQALLAAVTADGQRPVSPVRWARYDPPWTPWFLRRHEVLVTVAR